MINEALQIKRGVAGVVCAACAAGGGWFAVSPPSQIHPSIVADEVAIRLQNEAGWNTRSNDYEPMPWGPIPRYNAERSMADTMRDIQYENRVREQYRQGRRDLLDQMRRRNESYRRIRIEID